MTKRKALDGKPYEGKPHGWFDGGDWLSVIFACVAFLCSSESLGETTYVDVSTTAKLTVSADETVLRPVVAEETIVDPATLEAPVFWLDAGNTNGWTVAANGDVSVAISKLGVRTLSAVAPVGWGGWQDGALVSPKYVAQDEITGLACVDFGSMGSGRAFTFDGGGLSGIGTVFMVRDTSAGGGWIFTGTASSPNAWKRGNNIASTSADDPRYTLADSTASDALVRNALMRQDGCPYVSKSVGWAGKWEVFSFSPVEAALTASGLGINDFGSATVNVSGGFKIAEMIVYDRVLDASEVAGVERFLEKKWLARLQAKKESDTRVDLLYASKSAAGGLSVGVDVASGMEFLVKDVRGGHDGAVDGNAKIVKTGEGSLRLGDFSRYNGKIVLNGGDLAMDYAERKRCTSNIAARAVYHIDPSVASTRTDVVENGRTYVMRIDDVDGNRRASDGALFNFRSLGVETQLDGETEYQVDRRIYLCTDYETPSGLPMLDFGPFGSWGHYWSHQLDFYAGDVQADPCLLTTVIAVVGAQRGGGWLMNNGFKRKSADSAYQTALVDSGLSISSSPALTPADGVVYLDGKKVDSPATTGYPDNGFHVIAIQLPGTKPNQIGSYWRREGGGLIMGEMLAWSSPLNEREILEVQEYLSRKWLCRSVCAYDETLPRQDDVADVQNVAVEGASSITVSGDSARIGTLTVNAPFVKKGPGTLYVERLENPGNHAIALAGGSIRTVAAPEPSDAGIAQAPSLRIDLMNTNGWGLSVSDGRTLVTNIAAGGTAGVSLTASSKAPWLDADPELTPVAGVPVLNFGSYADTSAGANSKVLIFDRCLESVRSVFQVWYLPDGSGAQLVGSSGDSALNPGVSRYDFHRGYGSNSSSCVNGPILGGWSSNTGNAAQAARGGVIVQNGVTLPNTWQYQPTYGEWVVIESHTLAGCHASGIACDRGSMKQGGMALAELIVYERELTEREKVSTRNTLMKKWLGKTDEELEPVPDAEGAQPISQDSVVVVPGEPVGMEVSGTAGIERLSGSGTFGKSGSGTLTVGYINGFDGSLTVSGGVLKLQNAYVTEAKMAGMDKGLRFRIAADEITPAMCEANTDGTTGVKTWPSSVGDGWKAEAQERGYAIDGSATLSSNIPVYDDASLNGMPVVRMPQKTCFQFKNPAGEFSSITNIRTVLWVVGSQEGGGFLLGGGDLSAADGREKHYAWHRNSATSESAGRSKNDPITGWSASSAVRSSNGQGQGQWWRNSASVNSMSEPLSGGWDVVSYRNRMNDPAAIASASGLAFDGRIFAGENYAMRAGNQRLAELLIYTNTLSNAELLETECYLCTKWGLNHVLTSPVQDVDLWVAADAVVELGGYNLFRSVGGSGEVRGSFGAAAFVADAGETGLDVTGAVTIPETPAFAVKNVSTDFCRIVVAQASGGFSGSENLAGATFSGVPSRHVARVRIDGTRLVVSVRRSLGTCLIVK